MPRRLDGNIMKLFSGKKSPYVLIAFGVLAIAFALLLTPGGRQIWQLPRASSWKEANRSKLAEIFSAYPRVGIRLQMNRVFVLHGTVPSEADKRKLADTIDRLRPPLEVVNHIRVTVDPGGPNGRGR